MNITIVKLNNSSYRVNGETFIEKTAKLALAAYLSIHASGSRLAT